MAIQITDKKLNIDELVQRYDNVDQIDRVIDKKEKLKNSRSYFKALKVQILMLRLNEL